MPFFKEIFTFEEKIETVEISAKMEIEEISLKPVFTMGKSVEKTILRTKGRSKSFLKSENFYFFHFSSKLSKILILTKFDRFS